MKEPAPGPNLSLVDPLLKLAPAHPILFFSSFFVALPCGTRLVSWFFLPVTESRSLLRLHLWRSGLFTETHPCVLYKIPVRLAPLAIVGVGFISFSPHPVSSKRKSRAGRWRFALTTELWLWLFPAHRLSSSCAYMLESWRPSPPPLPAPWLGFIRCGVAVGRRASCDGPPSSSSDPAVDLGRVGDRSYRRGLLLMIKATKCSGDDWAWRNCSPYLELAAEPQRCMVELLHRSIVGERPPSTSVIPSSMPWAVRSFEWGAVARGHCAPPWAMRTPPCSARAPPLPLSGWGRWASAIDRRMLGLD
jgi:hypothetical protein